MTDAVETDIRDYVRELVRAARRRAGFEFLGQKESECERHGKFIHDEFIDKDGLVTAGVCPECHAENEKQREREESIRMQAENRARAIASKFESACIPQRFKDRTLSNYEIHCDKQAAVLEFCKTYAERFNEVLRLGSSIILSGTVGTGKTHLSIGIANEIISNGYAALFSTAAGIVRRVRSSWGKNDEDESAAMNIFIMPDLLIVDEVGVQSGSDNEHQILFEILNARYEACKPTILLTNLPLQDQTENGSIVRKGLKSFIGERLLDRMREGGGRAFTLDWKSGRIGR
ncbi:MAG TPA: ATP-binding protein [Marinagarivorans sp.]|nr:ATP-binding protein [Marinagarivorans sp.]HNG59618.1 ATP-binding protein [Cellvibrionaceae bacterium]